MFAIFAQATTPLQARDIWDVALQFGMAGAVIIIVVVFVWYMLQRDARDERVEKIRADAMLTLSKDVQTLNAGVLRLLERSTK